MGREEERIRQARRADMIIKITNKRNISIEISSLHDLPT